MTSPLIDAARQRTQDCIRAVERAVAELQRTEQHITIRGTASAAGVSRNFIYTSPTALAIVEAARQTTPKRRQSRPSRPASDESMRTRLLAASQRIEELERLNGQLRDENTALINEVMRLQNPEPENVTPLRNRRG